MWKTITNIVVSRFKTVEEDEEVLRKRSICKTCKYNSLNIEKLPLNKLILKKLSDFYSIIAGKKEEDVLGSCSLCGCSIYYKTMFPEENCHKNLWVKK